MNIQLRNGKTIPVEMHKVRIVQKINLPPAKRRLEAMTEAGYSTFLLRTRDVFLDMLTDSGTNAMSDNQLATMMIADDAYAGSESFFRLADTVRDILGFNYSIPVHQGRAAEHLLAKVFVKPGDVVLMNYHFTTTKAHFEITGATVLEIYTDEAMNTSSSHPFRGNLDLRKFQECIDKYGAARIPFVRMEASTNLIGGQPFSLDNLRQVKQLAAAHNIPLVYDGSLISENAYFIRERDPSCAGMSIAEIIREMMSLVDLLYLSARKSTCVRGGLMATNSKDYYDRILAWLYQHRELIGGLEFIEEPKVLRFFFGRLKALDGWGARLVQAFEAEFGTAC